MICFRSVVNFVLGLWFLVVIDLMYCEGCKGYVWV